MVFKTILLILVISVLMEDSASIKKSVEEEKEDEELARAVNKTLAEEEKKRQEEEDEKKKKDEKKSKKEDRDKDKDMKDKSEACPPVNTSCPIVKPCPPCPRIKECEPCKECPRCEEPEESEECPPLECPPVYCRPCPVVNSTSRGQELPSPPSCPDLPSMTVPTALAVGAVTGIMVTGIAAAVGLILRYVSPIVSGFLFLATIIIIWYLCSHHPETARELGGRAATLLREAATALGHRVMAALQRQADQVGLSSFSMPNLFF
jgi:hypothetical protein